jgi:hypothetical protein
VAGAAGLLVTGMLLARSGSPSSGPTAPTDVASRSVEMRVPATSAVNAGARYATLLAQLFPLDAGQARAVVADAASDESRAQLVEQIDASLVPLQQQAGDLNGVTTYRQAVLATRLESYAADRPATAGSVHQAATAAGARARVGVWVLLTVSHAPWRTGGSAAADTGDAANAVGSFSTMHLDLVWEHGAWRLDDDSTVDGPTPLIDGTPDTGSAVDAALRGFTDWRPR